MILPSRPSSVRLGQLHILSTPPRRASRGSIQLREQGSTQAVRACGHVFHAECLARYGFSRRGKELPRRASVLSRPHRWRPARPRPTSCRAAPSSRARRPYKAARKSRFDERRGVIIPRRAHWTSQNRCAGRAPRPARRAADHAGQCHAGPAANRGESAMRTERGVVLINALVVVLVLTQKQGD